MYRHRCRPGLAGPAEPTAIKCDRAEAARRHEHHLVVPDIRAQRPSMAETDRAAFAPVLIVYRSRVFRIDRSGPPVTYARKQDLSDRLLCASRTGRQGFQWCRDRTDTAQHREAAGHGSVTGWPMVRVWHTNLRSTSSFGSCVCAQFARMERSRKSPIIGAMTSSLSSSAKCPVSNRCSSALGRSRR